MVRKGCTFDEQVVHVGLNTFSYHSLENGIYKVLKGCTHVFEPEGHYNELIQALVGAEGCTLLIAGIHSDLVVIAVCIEERHTTLSDARIHELVDFGEWKGILGIGLGEVCVFDAHSLLAAWFAFHDDIEDLFGASGWFDASRYEEFVNLLCCRIPLFLTLVTLYLAYGLEGHVGVKGVLYNGGGNPN